MQTITGIFYSELRLQFLNIGWPLRSKKLATDRREIDEENGGFLGGKSGRKLPIIQKKVTFTKRSCGGDFLLKFDTSQGAENRKKRG